MFIVESKIQEAEFNRKRRNAEHYFQEESYFFKIVPQVRE